MRSRFAAVAAAALAGCTVLLYVCCESTGVAASRARENGPPSPRALTATDTVKESFLRFHFINPFVDARKLDHLFVKENLLASVGLLVTLACFLAWWLILGIRDGRPGQLLRLFKLHCMHILLFGKIENGRVSDAAELAVVGHVSTKQLLPVLRRRVLPGPRSDLLANGIWVCVALPGCSVCSEDLSHGRFGSCWCRFGTGFAARTRGSRSCTLPFKRKW